MNFLVKILQGWPVILLLILSAISVTAGDFFAKYWSTNQKTIFYILAILGYAGSSIFYIPTLLKEGLVVTSVIWSILSIIGFLIIGLVIFKETLSMVQIIGVTLGVASLILLSFE